MTLLPSTDIRVNLGYLEGFLKAIEIAAGRRARIAANAYAAGEDPVAGLRAFLRERAIASDPLTVSSVSREEFLLEVWRFSTDLLTGMSADRVEDFKWQFEECLGLLSTGLDPAGHFHPLFHCPLYRIVIQSQRPKTVLLVQLEDVVVALFCEDRAS